MTLYISSSYALFRLLHRYSANALEGLAIGFAKIWGFGFSLGLNVKRQEKVAGIDPHILEGFSYRLIEGIATRGAEVCTTWERGALGAYLRNTY